MESRLNVWRVTISVGIATALLYTACVLFDLAFPQWAMHPAWHEYLPGFEWISPGAFVLGLVEAFVLAGLCAWVFAVVYNLAGRKS